VIRGTRAILPSPRFFPRPGRIEFEVLEPLAPDPALPPERAATALRDAARAAILARVGEPDAWPGGPAREDARGERVG
jgi:1-acyl-sn-glycerol-3-phosphate acyltransferase